MLNPFVHVAGSDGKDPLLDTQCCGGVMLPWALPGPAQQRQEVMSMSIQVRDCSQP